MDREYLLDKATQYLELAAAPSVSPENVAFLRELAVSCFELANRAATSDTGKIGRPQEKQSPECCVTT
jgi:hypothetical protein